MALIKCPECGAEVSDRAPACIKCGYPLASEKSELIIYGLAQTFLIGGTINVLLDNNLVAKVRKGEKVVLPITQSCELTIKCGINIMKSRKIIHPGRTTKIQVIYDRLTGSFLLQELD